MTIVGSGQLYMQWICNEYGVPLQNAYLSQFRRGGPAGYVRANSGDNGAANASAGVPTNYINLYIGNFYGQGKGWTYTNNSVRVNNYHCHGEFGSDWLGGNGTGWPCTYVNNNGIYSTSTSYYALVIYARGNNGPFTFVNNSEIQGAGGPSNSAAGQHAVYIYNSGSVYAYRPIMINNYAIRGGGGAGGVGGRGGTGGQGYTQNWVYEGYPGIQTLGETIWTVAGNQTSGKQTVWWADVSIFGTGGVPAGNTTATSGNWTYFKAAYTHSANFNYYYKVYRGYINTNYYGGGGGGAGGAGGRGIGYNSANQGGAGGAPGGNGGTNAGDGGYGGTGGTGGSWGAGGHTGATGATGHGGNASGGTGGAAGAGGGAAGYSIYAASMWGYANYNVNQGPYGGGVANS